MVARDGTTWSGAAAIERLLDVLPKGPADLLVVQDPLRAAARRHVLSLVRAQPLQARLRRALHDTTAGRDVPRGGRRLTADAGLHACVVLLAQEHQLFGPALDDGGLTLRQHFRALANLGGSAAGGFDHVLDELRPGAILERTA